MNTTSATQTRNVALAITVVVVIAIIAIFGAPFSPQNPPPPPPSDTSGDPIRVTKPLENQAITSPFSIEGEARGLWFFEASFPVRLEDSSGKILTTAIAQAQGEWMTEQFVSFAAELFFTVDKEMPATLVFEKDNPSGLPENDAEFRLPVILQPGTTPSSRSVKLFYYNPDIDKDETGNILCSWKGLVPVDRTIPRSAAPYQETINLLLKGILTAPERTRGITTEYPLPGFKLASAVLTNGTLVLTFEDPQGKTTGGSCRVGILRSQIEATARQFQEVKRVEFLPEDLFQP